MSYKIIFLLFIFFEIQVKCDQLNELFLKDVENESIMKMQRWAQAGIDINFADHNGMTPLIFSAKENKNNSFKYLLLVS